GATASRNTGVLLVALPWWATLSTVLCRLVPSPSRIASVNASIYPVSNMLVAAYASGATTEFAWTSELQPTINGSRGLSTAAAAPLRRPAARSRPKDKTRGSRLGRRADGRRAEEGRG